MSYLDNQNIQIEVSNPLYFPDDSAPPVPNLSVSKISPEGASFIDEKEVVSITDVLYPRQATREANAYMHMIGTPSTRTYNSQDGVLTTTGDHIFYGRLNVDSQIPPFNALEPDSLETYFRELAPAICGLQTYNTTGSAYPLGFAHVAHNVQNSFALQGRSDIPLPLDMTQANSDPEKQRVLSPVGFSNVKDNVWDYDVIDYSIRIRKKHVNNQIGASRIVFRTDTFELQFSVEINNIPGNANNGRIFLGAYYFIFDNSGNASGAVTKIKEEGSLFSIDLNSLGPDGRIRIAEDSDYIYVNMRTRLDIVEKAYFTTHNGQSVTMWSSSNAPTVNWGTKQFNLQLVFAMDETYQNSSARYTVPMSIQVLGYTDKDLAPDLIEWTMDNTYPSPFESYFPIYTSPPSSEFPMVFPGYSGNIWEHVNKVSTNLSYSRQVG